jgi:hypothetical protein
MVCLIIQDYFGLSRTDDLAITAKERLLRHCRSPVQIVPCEINGRKISDQAFKMKPSEPGLSVDLEQLLLNQGLPTTYRYRAMPNTFAMLAVTADDARRCAGGVAWTPKPAEPLLNTASATANPYHGEIIKPMTSKSARDLYYRSTVVQSDLASAA